MPRANTRPIPGVNVMFDGFSAAQVIRAGSPGLIVAGSAVSSTIRATGHWEGDTLVVDTIALNPISYVEGFTPHSDAMTVKERIRFFGPGLLEDAITVTDPKAFTAPWSVVRHYKKAAPPNDEIREFACSELFLSTPIPK